MFEVTASPKLVILAVVLLVLYIVLKVRRAKVQAFVQSRILRTKRLSRLAFYSMAALCVPAGFLLMELPYNTELASMAPYYVFVGCALCAVVAAFIFFLGQRSKTSLGVFLFLCFVAGVANHFVVEFRGQPILPADLAALDTAADVSGGYVYAFDRRFFLSLILLEVIACIFALLPARQLSIKGLIVNLTLAVILAIGGVVWFNVSDIEENLNCTIDVWSSLDSCRQQGMLLCFLQRAQQLVPDAPEGYSVEAAQALQEEAAEEYAASSTATNSSVLAATSSQDSTSTSREASSELPSVVIIMNETFSDISRYSAVDDSYEGPTRTLALSDEALLSGNAYVSALGGGTCNSEFELLTGCSLGLLGTGIYPYTLYNLTGVENLASYFGDLGYTTSAIHPAVATNWQRDKIYAQFGFDAFYDIESFQDAQTRRDLVTDAETYDQVLELLTSSDEPQFIFDVTIANHSGYNTGLLSEDEQLSITVDGEENAEVSEYVSCIEQSDIEFIAFIDQLRDLDEPVIVCMFGDHQPGFADTLAEASFGVSTSDMDIIQVQERYITPYLIWTNSEDIQDAVGVGNTLDLSLNYLGLEVLNLAGLPLDNYYAFLSQIQELMPIINLCAYQDAEGAWYWHGEESESEVSQAYSDLAIVQYYRLFDAEN